jgi:cob(I)alamin adenosyltransferase
LLNGSAPSNFSEVEQQLSAARTTPKHELVDLLQNISADVDELEDTVKIVTQNPARFHIDRAEIEQRKQFIAQCRQKVHELKTSVLKAYIDAYKENSRCCPTAAV